VTSREDARPCSACLLQARADQAEREAKGRKNKRQPCRKNLGWPPQECTVGTASVFCGYATNEVDRDASMLSCSSRNAQEHNAHTHTHTHTHSHTHAHTHTHTGAHTHTGTHTHRHTCTYAHTCTHTHSLAPLHTCAHTHTHTHMHTL